MTILIILSLITLAGLFAVYQVIAWDKRATAALKNSGPVFLKDTSAPSPDSVVRKKESVPNVFKSLRTDFSFLGKYKKESFKVEPITNLKDYYSSQSDVGVSEIDLTDTAPKAGGKSALSEEDRYADLKIRFQQLDTAHGKLEALFKEAMVKLEQAHQALQTELVLRQDVERIKAGLEKQLAAAYRELEEQNKLIESTKDSFENRLSPQTFLNSTDFVRLPPDLMANAGSAAFENPQQEKQDKIIESSEDRTAGAPYRMPSEDAVIRLLKNKKYSV